MIKSLKKIILYIPLFFITFSHIQTMNRGSLPINDIESAFDINSRCIIEKDIIHYKKYDELLHARNKRLSESLESLEEQNQPSQLIPTIYNNHFNNIPITHTTQYEYTYGAFDKENQCDNTYIAALIHAARYQEPVKSKKSEPFFSLLEIIKNINIESLKIVRQQLVDAKRKIEQELSKKNIKEKNAINALKDQQFYINKQLNFIDCFINEKKIIKLLHLIESASPKVACRAFETLRWLWPWTPNIKDRLIGWGSGNKKSFLCDSLITPEEQAFINLLPYNIIQKAEECLVSRQDVLYYLSPKQCGSIENAFKNYHKLQILGEQKILLREKHILEEILVEGYYVNSRPFLRANLAIVNNLLSSPLTDIYANIAYSDYATAYSQINDFQKQLQIECVNNNVFTYDKAQAYFEKKYGYNVLSSIHECFKLHHGCNFITTNPMFFNPVILTLATITEGDFHCANNALKNLEQRMIKEYGSALSDLQEVYENMIQKEGFNVIEVAYKAIESRPDYHKRKHELTPVFEPINAQQNIIKAIDSYSDNITLADELEDLSHKVFDHVNEHGYIIPRTIESEVDNSIETIKITENPITLIFNIAKVDNLLDNVQALVCYAEQHLPHSVKRSLELFARGAAKFITGLNPVEQLKNVYELAEIVGKTTFNVALYPRETAEKISTFIVNTVYIMSNTTVYDEILPLEEIQRRADNACMYFEKLPLKDFENLITADNVVDCVAQIAADTVFLGGIGKASKFVKNLDAISKIKCRASKIAKRFKKVIDTHLADNPILITAEGLTLKMSNDIKNISEIATNIIINNSKLLLESSLIKKAINLEESIKKIRQIYDGTRFGFAQCALQKIKMDYEHILGIVIEWSNTGKALKLNGFHHDFSNILEKSGALKIMKRLHNEYGCYVGDVIVDSTEFRGKTFFPAEWSREKVVSKIYEAYDNFIKSGAIKFKEKAGKYKIVSATNDGLEIEMYITKNGHLKTAFPYFEKRL